MRIAVVSDIHGNLTALEAVLRDLRETSPDLVLHGGDLADGGASPVEVVDRLRELDWPGVIGNTDELLAAPETFTAFAAGAAAVRPLVPLIESMAAHSRDLLGPERLSWLGSLPRTLLLDDVAVVHASPASPWRSPGAQATDEELTGTYGPLARPVAVYGHIHRSFVRKTAATTVVNSGSVSLSYDGDPRAAYLILDDGAPAIRRVVYDIEREVRALETSGLPHADWLAATLRAAALQMPKLAS